MNKVTPTAYHHGDLPAALRAATAELIAERGPTGFSLREVARRAEVSHAAPAHHFGSAKGLLTAVAIEGFEQLNQAFRAAIERNSDPVDRFTDLGKAYVNTALGSPGHFGIMCNEELVDKNDERFAVASVGAFQMLRRVVGEVAEVRNPSLDIEAAALMSWSMVHGLATLHQSFASVADSKIPGSLDETLEQFTQILIEGFSG